MYAGEIAEEHLQEVFERLNTALKSTREKKGQFRTAAGGEQGHQRTPAMIEALLRDALAKPVMKGMEQGDATCGPNLPVGGFTDVGQHTGGRPRETAWPLARAVFQVKNCVKHDRWVSRFRCPHCRHWSLRHSSQFRYHIHHAVTRPPR